MQSRQLRQHVIEKLEAKRKLNKRNNDLPLSTAIKSLIKRPFPPIFNIAFVT